jgi:excisionase family DNA binding protein
MSPLSPSRYWQRARPSSLPTLLLVAARAHVRRMHASRTASPQHASTVAGRLRSTRRRFRSVGTAPEVSAPVRGASDLGSVISPPPLVSGREHRNRALARPAFRGQLTRLRRAPLSVLRYRLSVWAGRFHPSHSNSAPRPTKGEELILRFDQAFPALLTAEEVASHFLRTSRRAVYQMVQRDQIPGVIRIGRRLLFRKDTLVAWLENQGGDRERHG